MYECAHPDLPPTAQMFPMEDRGTREGMDSSIWPFLEVASLEKREGGDYRRECVLCPGGGGLGNAATPPSSPLWCCNWDSFQK